MDNRQCPRICPVCGAPVSLFLINFTEKLLMCEDSMCDFPFGYEELQIVTDESQLRDNVTWHGARSLPDADMSSSTSVVSTTAWADIEQLTRLYDSDASTTDTKLYQQSELARKRREKKKYDEEMAQNINCIKKLNDELNQLKRKERNRRIEEDNILENLLRLQNMHGRQMLKKEEFENLQKKEAKLGIGELKVNIINVPNRMGVINIELSNNDNEYIVTEINDNEDIETAENKIQINIEEEISGNNQTDNNETQITTNITEEVATKIIPDNKPKETITPNKTNEENTKDDSFTVNNNNENDNLQNLEIMEEGVTEENEIQASVNPGDNLQIVGNLQVLGLVDNFSPITLEELTSSVVSEGPILQESMIDEMEVIIMNEGVPEEIQVTVVEQKATVEDKMEVIVEKEMQDTIENKMQDNTENKMENNTENKMQDTTKDKMQVTAEKTPVIAENMQVSTTKDIQKVTTENKIQVTTKSKMRATTEKEIKVTIEKDMQVNTEIEMQVPAMTKSLAAATITSVEIQPTSEPVEPIPPVLKRKRGRPRKVLIEKTIDIISIDETAKQVEQNEQWEQNKVNNVADVHNSVDIETKDQNSSLEMDKTVSSNEDQNETIEQSDVMNASAESSVVKIPKKKGRKKGQKGVKRIVTDIRRSNRLSGKNT